MLVYENNVSTDVENIYTSVPKETVCSKETAATMMFISALLFYNQTNMTQLIASKCPRINPFLYYTVFIHQSKLKKPTCWESWLRFMESPSTGCETFADVTVDVLGVLVIAMV